MKRHIYIAFLMVAPMLFAEEVTYDGREKLYFNIKPSHASFWADGSAQFCAYFFNNQKNTNAWAKNNAGKVSANADKVSGNIYSVVVPAGTWDHVILTRHNNTATTLNFTNTWNQTYDIELNHWNNYLADFRYKGDSSNDDAWNWDLYTPAPSGSPTSVASAQGITIEYVHACDSAVGDPISLNPRMKADMSDFDYENTTCHGWFRSTNNGSTWTALDLTIAGARSDDKEGDKDYFKETIGAVGSTTYYYLYAKRPQNCRMIEVKVDLKCGVDCDITAFEMVASAVNANDSTYIVDGMISFTSVPSDLTVEASDGQSVTIKADSLRKHNPYTFSLPPLRADGKQDVFTASFVGQDACKQVYALTAPTASEGVVEVAMQREYKYGEEVVLSPTTSNGSGRHRWAWADGEEQREAGEDATITLPVFYNDTTVVYYYTEENPAPTIQGDLMGNGSYETISGYNYTQTSAYDYTGVWEGSKKNVYSQAQYAGKRGLFGVTTDSYVFWEHFVHLKPHHGKYYAVFDGDENQDKAAWKASTGTANPNLKLLKGTTYLFSFWVANVNNYGELVNNGKKNCAKLQFHIRCKDKATGTWYEKDLGTPINLADDKYMNKMWHQNSATFSTLRYFGVDFDSDDVTISVIDKNNNGVVTGNDFALDDIQFRAVSTVSRTVKACEKFTVVYSQTEAYYDTICQGNRYLQYGLDLTPYSAGEYKYPVNGGHDTLFLHVAAEPTVVVSNEVRFCQDLTEVLLPISVQGEAKSYSYVFDDNRISSQTDVPLTRDTIQIPLPGTISGGEYRGRLTIIGKGTSCESTTDFTLNLSFADLMYKKWNDVLFVSNKDSLYTDFQWFRNGKIMDGETQQRLYDPAGLSGAFYCRMTTRYGQTHYTCEQDFSEVQRSADAPKQKTQIKRVDIFDIYGNLLLTVSLTDDEQTYPMPNKQGIYLIRKTNTDNQIQTEKLIVP